MFNVSGYVVDDGEKRRIYSVQLPFACRDERVYGLYLIVSKVHTFSRSFLVDCAYAYQKVRISSTKILNFDRRWQAMRNLEALIQTWPKPFLCTERLKNEYTHADNALPCWVVPIL